jgi:hypothetical protein
MAGVRVVLLNRGAGENAVGMSVEGMADGSPDVDVVMLPDQARELARQLEATAAQADMRVVPDPREAKA